MRNRKVFLDEAVALAPAGVVSLLTDGPVARPGHVEDPTPLNTQQVTDLIQQIVDMRRGADLLLARPDVDAKRLAYVGHSYNASVGGFLSGIDKRFVAFVLMAGGLSDESDLKTKEMQEYRQNWPGKVRRIPGKIRVAGSGQICLACCARRGVFAVRFKGGVPEPRSGARMRRW
jgi:dienelactone hydrolase